MHTEEVLEKFKEYALLFTIVSNIPYGNWGNHPDYLMKNGDIIIPIRENDSFSIRPNGNRSVYVSEIFSISKLEYIGSLCESCKQLVRCATDSRISQSQWWNCSNYMADGGQHES